VVLVVAGVGAVVGLISTCLAFQFLSREFGSSKVHLFGLFDILIRHLGGISSACGFFNTSFEA
jgi:hypothetical protein